MSSGKKSNCAVIIEFYTSSSVVYLVTLVIFSPILSDYSLPHDLASKDPVDPGPEQGGLLGKDHAAEGLGSGLPNRNAKDRMSYHVQIGWRITAGHLAKGAIRRFRNTEKSSNNIHVYLCICTFMLLGDLRKNTL